MYSVNKNQHILQRIYNKYFTMIVLNTHNI